MSHTPGLGVNVTVAESVLGEPGVQAWSVIALTDPLMALAAAKLSSQVSRSDPVRVTAIGMSSSVVTALSSAAGGSLMQLTVMVTVAGAEVSVPSSTV